jgi:5-dehydro-2-deoxygluconokinase
MATNPGFTKDLFIMPFDHRGSFAEKLFGIKGRQPTPEETKEISLYKRTIYNGFKHAIANGVPKDKAGILVDEQFGSEIIADAKKGGYMTAVCAEKSGQDEFDFEYGKEYGAHIAKLGVTFVKVLVRYNPEGDKVGNERQLGRLKELSDYCHKNGNKFMFELLVPATKDQLAKAGSQGDYDSKMRPSLMATAMKQIQDFGVEPDLWKLEGVENQEDCRKVADTARNASHRKEVGVILLGRGENSEKVKHWLTTAAKVPGLIGFAVGRTIFWEPLKGVKDGKWSHEEAAKMVGQNYKGFCDLWQKARA